MRWFWQFSVPLLFSACYQSSSILIDPADADSTKKNFQLDSSSPENQLNQIFLGDDAQESANFFTPDLGSYDSPNFYANLPYFPEFGEIFRIAKTTTPEPPFKFPEFSREAFPENLPINSGSASGGRRPSGRPPRPASSGTRTKVTKQNQSEPKEKPRSPKSKSLNKSRNYPKIFRFNLDRVNLADFDMKKKINENYMTLLKGDELDYNKVKRNKFLILHGGVFEIERSRRRGLYHSSSNSHADVISSEDSVYGFNTNGDKLELESVQYLYKV